MYGTPRKTKAAMLANLPETPVKAHMAANNTLDYVTQDGTRKVRLHNTDILIFKPNGAIEIRPEGWNTVTTRDRINTFLPKGAVYTRKGQIYYTGDVPFNNVLTIGPRGAIKSDMTQKKVSRNAKRLDAFMRHVRKTGLPSVESSCGDPWVFAPDQVDASVAWDWIDTKYFTRRLYALALEFAGMQPQGIALWMHMADRDGLQTIDYSRIRRYLRSRIGMEH